MLHNRSRLVNESLLYTLKGSACAYDRRLRSIGIELGGGVLALCGIRFAQVDFRQRLTLWETHRSLALNTKRWFYTFVRNRHLHREGSIVINSIDSVMIF